MIPGTPHSGSTATGAATGTGPRSGHRSGPVRNAWMIAFTDLLALMLTFFVLMFSMSSVKHDAWDALVSALTRQLSTVEDWRDPRLEADRTVPRVAHARAVDLDYLAGVLVDKFTRMDGFDSVIVTRLDDRLVVSLPGDLVFQAGGATIAPGGLEAARTLTAALNVIANRVDVVGHTEPVGGAGLGAYGSDWELSLARAVVFANALRAAGYPHRVTTFGLASSRFYELAPAAPAALRARMGRRVDLVIRETKANELADGS